MQNQKVNLVNKALGSSKRQGSERLYTCPFCGHHKKKFSVNFELNVYKCWVCDARGRDIRRIIRRFGSFTDLKEWDQLSGIVDFSKHKFELFPVKEEEVAQRIDLPEEFKTLTGKITPADLRPFSYLQNRGLSKYDLLRYKIGYCSEGAYAGRIIIPSFDLDGYVNYFIARTYNDHKVRYKNPSASKDIIFNELNIDWDSDVILVEGVFDAIFSDNSVALLGSTMREESKLFQQIIMNDSSVFIALDHDAEKKAMDIANTLLKYDVEVWMIEMPEGKDVASIGKEQFRELKEQATLMHNNQDLILRKRVMSL